MSLYQAIRPKTFDEVLGNTATIKALQAICKQPEEKRNHTILLTGPSGCGKTTLARILANEFGANDFSIFELNASNTRGIDTFRDVDSECRMLPLKGSVKVYVIDESGQMTNAAQQALLKTLEDYPKHVYFILCTTAPENLIATIRNRCSTFQVGPLGRKDMEKLLGDICKKVGYVLTDDIMRALLIFSEGSPRSALVRLESILYLEDESDALDLISIGTEVQPEILDLCILLSMAPVKREASWAEAVKMVNTLSGDSEVTRRAIIGFFNSKLLRCEKPEIAIDYVSIIRKFSVSTLYHGKPLLSALVFEACVDTKKEKKV